MTTEQKAEEARQWVEVMKVPSGLFQQAAGEWPRVIWRSDRKQETIRLFDDFTPAQLRALADYMESANPSPDAPNPPAS